MTTDSPSETHSFTGSWRWPSEVRDWVASLVTGQVANVCAGLSTVGDVHIDLMDAPEIITRLATEEDTPVEKLRELTNGLHDSQSDHLRDHIATLSAGGDVSGTSARALQRGTTLRADVFNQPLPVATDSMDWVVSDPPWKAVDEADREFLFDQLVRICRPGGHILLNAPWVSAHPQVTIDAVRVRQDRERHAHGTPNVSYFTVYRVYGTEAEAKAQRLQLEQPEYAPELEDIDDIARASLAAEIRRHSSHEVRTFDLDAIVSTDHQCPQCGSPALWPATDHGGYSPGSPGSLYRCEDCGFPATVDEIHVAVR